MYAIVCLVDEGGDLKGLFVQLCVRHGPDIVIVVVVVVGAKNNHSRKEVGLSHAARPALAWISLSRFFSAKLDFTSVRGFHV